MAPSGSVTIAFDRNKCSARRREPLASGAPGDRGSCPARAPPLPFDRRTTTRSGTPIGSVLDHRPEPAAGVRLLQDHSPPGPTNTRKGNPMTDTSDGTPAGDLASEQRRLISASSEIIDGLTTILPHTSGPDRESLAQRISDEVDVFLFKWYGLITRDADPAAWTDFQSRRDHQLCLVIVAVLRSEGAIADDSAYPPGAYPTISNERLVKQVSAAVEVEREAIGDALLRLHNYGVFRETVRRVGPAKYALNPDYQERVAEMAAKSDR